MGGHPWFYEVEYEPTRYMVEESVELFDSLERGRGVYIVLYDGDTPSGIFFAGYSFD
jgi:hypothetical protein